MITKNRRVKKMILTDGREIPITEEQYKSIRADIEIKSYNDIITIADADNRDRIIFDGKVSSIKEFQDLFIQDTKGMGGYCDFGHWHYTHETCNHPDIYNMAPITFQFRVFEKYPNINYNHQITEKMRSEILKK